MSTSNDSNTNNNSRLTATNVEISEYMNKIALLENKKAKLVSENKQLENDHTRLESTVEDASRSLRLLTKKNTELKEQNTKWKKQFGDTILPRINDCELKIDSLQKEITSLNNQLKVSGEKLKYKEMHYKTLLTKFTEQTTILSEKEYSKLKNNFPRKTEETNELKSNHLNELTQYERDIKGFKRDYDDLNDKLKDLKDEITTKEKIVETASLFFNLCTSARQSILERRTIDESHVCVWSTFPPLFSDACLFVCG